MASNSLPRTIDNHRAPGERPAWCQQDKAEDPGIDTRAGNAVLFWSREFGTRHLGADLVAEDHIGTNGAEAHDTLVCVNHPENRGMTLDEAEQLALIIIDAVKAAREGEAQR